MRNTEQDWNTYGQRLRISQALDTRCPDSARIKPRASARHGIQRSVLRAALTMCACSQRSPGRRGWTALTLPVPADQSRGRIILTRQSGGARSCFAKPLRRRARSRCECSSGAFRDSVLDHAFLRSPNWRSKQSFVISDGLATSAPSELVPRVISALVIAKGLELTFSSEDSWRTVAQALATSDSVSLGASR